MVFPHLVPIDVDRGREGLQSFTNGRIRTEGGGLVRWFAALLSRPWMSLLPLAIVGFLLRPARHRPQVGLRAGAHSRSKNWKLPRTCRCNDC